MRDSYGLLAGLLDAREHTDCEHCRRAILLAHAQLKRLLEKEAVAP